MHRTGETSWRGGILAKGASEIYRESRDLLTAVVATDRWRQAYSESCDWDFSLYASMHVDCLIPLASTTVE